MRIYPVQCAWQLGTNEVKDFSVDVGNELQSGESIMSADWTAEPDDLTFSPASTINGTVITQTISMPQKSTAYNIVVHVTTSLTKEFDVPLLIGGVDKSR